eukprot:scaffold1954_cov268-Pinguiococcus_pyrenoidosus.AAC.242
MRTLRKQSFWKSKSEWRYSKRLRCLCQVNIRALPTPSPPLPLFPHPLPKEKNPKRGKTGGSFGRLACLSLGISASLSLTGIGFVARGKLVDDNRSGCPPNSNGEGAVSRESDSTHRRAQARKLHAFVSPRLRGEACERHGTINESSRQQRSVRGHIDSNVKRAIVLHVHALQAPHSLDRPPKGRSLLANLRRLAVKRHIGVVEKQLSTLRPDLELLSCGAEIDAERNVHLLRRRGQQGQGRGVVKVDLPVSGRSGKNSPVRGVLEICDATMHLPILLPELQRLCVKKSDSAVFGFVTGFTTKANGDVFSVGSPSKRPRQAAQARLSRQVPRRYGPYAKQRIVAAGGELVRSSRIYGQPMNLQGAVPSAEEHGVPGVSRDLVDLAADAADQDTSGALVRRHGADLRKIRRGPNFRQRHLLHQAERAAPDLQETIDATAREARGRQSANRGDRSGMRLHRLLHLQRLEIPGEKMTGCPAADNHVFAAVSGDNGGTQHWLRHPLAAEDAAPPPDSRPIAGEEGGAMLMPQQQRPGHRSYERQRRGL